MSASERQEDLAKHLSHWGLRPFTSEDDYARYQRTQLRPADLAQLLQRSEARQGGASHEAPADGEAERAFYDFAAQPQLYPILYSQRYHYYLTLGTAIAERLGHPQRILDLGCGLGILTTWYARQVPETVVVGVDRSAASIGMAREQAARLGLSHCSFLCLDLDRDRIDDQYDLIIASQCLFQSEQDPGLPSLSWQTCARAHDPAAQQRFEQTTGVGARLDRVKAALAPHGRLVLCEKARHLGRRIGFQRALAARGFFPISSPQPIQYRTVEEITEDGPLYELSREAAHPAKQPFDETPERLPGDGGYRLTGPGAEGVWRRLPGRSLISTISWTDPKSPSGTGVDTRTGSVAETRAGTVEWGQAGSLTYLYAQGAIGLGGLHGPGGRHGQPSPDSPHSLCGLLVMPRSAQDEHLAKLWQTLTEARDDGAKIAAALDDLFRHAQPLTDHRNAPLYESHCLAAQDLYAQLTNRRVTKVLDEAMPDGRQLHIERGRVEEWDYLYCANTYDQRQILLVETDAGHMLDQYYDELTGEHRM